MGELGRSKYRYQNKNSHRNFFYFKVDNWKTIVIQYQRTLCHIKLLKIKSMYIFSITIIIYQIMRRPWREIEFKLCIVSHFPLKKNRATLFHWRSKYM